MANEILSPKYPAGAVLYGHLFRCVDGLVYNGTTFEAPTVANWATYTRTVTEYTGTGYYAASMPTLPAGLYQMVFLLQEGGAAAAADPEVGRSTPIDWRGTTEATVAGVPDALLGRTRAGGADGGRTVSECLAAGRNKVALDVPAEGQFTVFDDDDVTPLYTGAYVRDPAAVGALTVIDPG